MIVDRLFEYLKSGPRMRFAPPIEGGPVLPVFTEGGLKRAIDAAALVANRAGASFAKQFYVERERRERLSGSGPWFCARKPKLLTSGERGEAPEPRTMFNWFLGDTVEAGIVGLCALDPFDHGRFTEGARVGELHTPLPGLDVEVPGHCDGIFEPIEGEDGHPAVLPGYDRVCLGWEAYSPNHALYVVEVKKVSEYGYQEFLEGGMEDTFGYRTQGSVYSRAKELVLRAGGPAHVGGTIFIAINGNTGHVAERFHPFLEGDLDRAVEVARAQARPLEEIPMLELDQEVERKKPTGRWKLALQCTYCEFATSKRADGTPHCFGERAKIEYVSTRTGSKPVFIVEDTSGLPIGEPQEMPF